MKNAACNNVLFLIIVFIFTFTINLRGADNSSESEKSIQNLALDDSLIPIHPGKPDQVPFWNSYSKCFIYAPCFDFKTVPGSHNYRFVTKNYSPSQIEGEILYNLPLEWYFRTDPQDIGLNEKWYQTKDFNEKWKPILTNKDWISQGYDYHGVAWYLVSFQICVEEAKKTVFHIKDSNLVLGFGAIDGYAEIFLDGKKIGEQKRDLEVMWNRTFNIQLPKDFDPAVKHTLIVRVQKDRNGAGIWKPVAIAVEFNKTEYTFNADVPWACLSPIWRDLPFGFVNLRVEGLDSKGTVIGISGEREFYKLSAFKESGIQGDYRKSAVQALDYLVKCPYTQHWLTGEVDSSYILSCYPSKMIPAIINGVILYSKITPAYKKEASLIAKNAADYLIPASKPLGHRLEFFTPTYMDNNDNGLALERFSGQLMLIYPAEAALAYLNLFDFTQEQKYFASATQIADTYVKLQMDNGTWPLNVDTNTGKQVGSNFCIPIIMLNLFDRLVSQYNLNKYENPRERAFKWIMENPAKTFNWEGQFEDQYASKPYVNLTEHDACSFAIYLLDRGSGNPDYLALALELIRFAEDQFVVWDKPMPQNVGGHRETNNWVDVPCVLEQYVYYVPIDASASKMIAAYKRAYEITKNKLYLAKACTLANSLVKVQDLNTGVYPTVWLKSGFDYKEIWLNCLYYDCSVMMELADMLESNNGK